ncbi:MAG: hypothetical protein JRD43_04890 [Deltaproteobacteria bacterium]|nr:hypothetical protein [Deltaproteobacteria bacterium]MBW2595628.1 hypothetical protein [Deltaproteobacteria bacterium]MBW2649569.1 hypothetical protein [Deltaproteobacteria bacterium]
MEMLYSVEVIIPISQIALLLLISTLALLFGRVKMALLINYVFTLYWGFLANEGFLAGSTFNTVSYFGFGFLVIILALIGFFTAAE